MDAILAAGLKPESTKIRPHLPATGFDYASPVPEHSPVGCGEESPRSCQRGGRGNGTGSATVPGRIWPTTDRTTVFDRANLVPKHSPVGTNYVPGTISVPLLPPYWRLEKQIRRSQSGFLDWRAA
ncbi:MAG: hypothetical protein GX456_17135 [Verrucomicrobia bacterium]|nr:hypothetical protein [Verrucomicrobiota bacterium]